MPDAPSMGYRRTPRYLLLQRGWPTGNLETVGAQCPWTSDEGRTLFPGREPNRYCGAIAELSSGLSSGQFGNGKSTPRNEERPYERSNFIASDKAVQAAGGDTRIGVPCCRVEIRRASYVYPQN